MNGDVTDTRPAAAHRHVHEAHTPHGHDHAHPHDHELAGSSPRRQFEAHAGSLLMASAALRVAVALGLIVGLWLAVAWALAGTP